ncbi:aminoglycoside phosphotransferase family protein [Agromyces aurantiacus]|uniref:Aminoglycoside phosphotransferase family protein n=1 Tax=Agromyces aurantiacus TaxID=165814 RepID=A0ABV9R6Y4_9MICO|nr:aminoglycoside phosphotransferase family protein [Agromyces aurantiacus]MBM7503707.1 aminoglycoside phosphotransferase (APT) family kinase protein [Agromyces aurantiacus]
MTLHADELPITADLAASVVRRERPDWAHLPLAPAGGGTDNVMFRLGDELLVRMPRTPGGVGSLHKEREWLPRLAPALPVRIPEPVHAGSPSPDYPLDWAVYRWIDGAPPASDTVADWARFGADVAEFVRDLHGIDLMGQERAGALSWYRGGSLRETESWVGPAFAASRPLVGDALDLDRLEAWWRDGLALPDSPAAHVWLHGDLRPGNLLAHEGRLHAVIDFGALSVGAPDAEHAAIWDLPPEARRAYWHALDLDEHTWLRARAWAIVVAISGIPYYWETFPEFVAECRARLESILAHADAEAEAEALAPASPVPRPPGGSAHESMANAPSGPPERCIRHTLADRAVTTRGPG